MGQTRTIVAGAIALFACGQAAAGEVSLSKLTPEYVCSKWYGRSDEAAGYRDYFADLYLYAQLSREVYADKGKGDGQYSTQDLNGNVRAWTVREMRDGHNRNLYDTGLYAVAIVNSATSDLVVVVRGSANSHDWKRNFDPGEVGDQHILVADFVSAVARKYGRIKAIAGHSRGGQLAMYAALKTGVPAVTFNTAILPKNFFETLSASNRRNSARIHNVYSATGDFFNAQRDLISQASGIFASGGIVGKTDEVYYDVSRGFAGPTEMRGDRVYIYGDKLDFRPPGWLGGDTIDQTVGAVRFISGADHSIERLEMALRMISRYFDTASTAARQCSDRGKMVSALPETAPSGSPVGEALGSGPPLAVPARPDQASEMPEKNP